MSRYILTLRGPCIVVYSYNKTSEVRQFLKFVFCYRNLHVSGSFSIHHQESRTVHTGYADCFLASSQHILYDIYPIAVFTVLDS